MRNRQSRLKADPADVMLYVPGLVVRCSYLMAAFALMLISPIHAAMPEPAPDLSGTWAHSYWPSFDPALSGQGPIVNRLRLPNGNADTTKLVGDYTSPILKPEAAEIVRKHGEISRMGAAYPTPANECWPQPVPYILWNPGIQILQDPHQVTILYNRDHEVRHVRMNAQHPARMTPSWYGDSVGHYEGDTLVVDTVGIRTNRPFAMTDMYGTPYSNVLHVVERYRLVDQEAALLAEARTLKENTAIPFNDSGLMVDETQNGNSLQLNFTVEDEAVFTVPWSASMTYRRAAEGWPEYVCSENRYEYYSGRESNVPHADAADF
jgi:hypothetical protein